MSILASVVISVLIGGGIFAAGALWSLGQMVAEDVYCGVLHDDDEDRLA